MTLPAYDTPGDIHVRASCARFRKGLRCSQQSMQQQGLPSAMRLKARSPVENPVETCRTQSVADRQRYRIRSDDRHFDVTFSAVASYQAKTSLLNRIFTPIVLNRAGKDVASRVLEKILNATSAPLASAGSKRSNPYARSLFRDGEPITSRCSSSVLYGQRRERSRDRLKPAVPQPGHRSSSSRPHP